jgi:predicted Zn finger-like uncharacterized protein
MRRFASAVLKFPRVFQVATVNDSELRYTFACPACSSSFSISLERIPPVQARFSCPKCGKPMDFPSRDEARVYIQLQGAGGAAAAGEPEQAAAAPVAAEPPPRPAPPPPPVAPPPPAARAPEPPAAPKPAPPRPLEPPGAPAGGAPEKTYRVEDKGFERDVYDRRAMRTLIRTLAVNETSMVSVGDAAPIRASEIPELKSLFELRKTARATPPPVCRAHTEVVAHYVCADTGRPLCEECAPEKKFGGAALRVCDHCGGTAKDLHEAPAEID